MHNRVLFSTALLVLLASCTTTNHRHVVERGYELNKEYEISRGEPIFSARTLELYEADVFVGLIYGGTVQDVWEEEAHEYELIFDQVDGGVLETSYKYVHAPGASAVSLGSSVNPMAPSPMTSRPTGRADTNFRRVDFKGITNGVLVHDGVEFEIIEARETSLRFRILSDPFGESDPVEGEAAVDPSPVES